MDFVRAWRLYWMTEYEERLIDARLEGDTHRQRVLRGRIQYLRRKLGL